MALESRRQLLISRGWVQAVAIVMISGFTVMGMLAYRTYTGEPPIPARVTDDSGHVLFTRTDIFAGQAVFLRNGLMEYGLIFGHGAYLKGVAKPRFFNSAVESQ
jgi:nitric oxide reductase subunit B